MSLVGHLAGGGSAPDEATLLLAVTVMVVACRALAATRERSWPVISLGLGLAEAVLHLLFGLGAHTMTGSADTAAGGMPPEMAMLGTSVVQGHGTAVLLMLVGHGAAAVLLGWVLRHGERVLWSAARRAAAGVREIVRTVFAMLASVTGRAVEVGRGLSVPVPGPELDCGTYRTSGGRLWRGPPSIPVLTI